MEVNIQVLITVLLTLLNVIGGLMIWRIDCIHKDLKADVNDVRAFTKDTRKKIDSHCENFAIHSTR